MNRDSYNDQKIRTYNTITTIGILVGISVVGITTLPLPLPTIRGHDDSEVTELKSEVSSNPPLFEPPSQASSSNTQDQSRRNHQNNTPSSRPLTEDEAVVIVNRWLSAKPRIFGPPFDRNLLGQLSTGSIYQSNLGSIDWLQNNGYYYAYTVSEIRNVWSFTTSDTNPSVTVNVYEDLTLHGPRGIDRSKSGASTRNFIYYFSRDVDGQWKISSYGRAE